MEENKQVQNEPEMGVEEIYYRGGCLSEPKERLESDLERQPIESRAVLPALVDWSAEFPNPGDQGDQNSCVGWAFAYALKSFQEKQERSSDSGWNFKNKRCLFSPSFVYNQINGGKDEGSKLLDAASLIVAQGVCTLEDMPYTNYLQQPNNEQRLAAAKFKAFSYASSGQVQVMKEQLANKNPVVIGGIPMSDNLRDLKRSNPIYSVTNAVNLYYNSYHAVCLVGYDDAKQAFKFVNSWRIGWCLDGYGYISYEMVDKYSNGFWLVDKIDLKGISLSADQITLRLPVEQQHTLQLTTQPQNATNKKGTWSSSNPLVATVSQLGVITATSPGETKIQVTCQDEVTGTFSKTCTVKVIEPWKAQVLTDDILPVLARGANYPVMITVKNTGTESWDKTNYALYYRENNELKKAAELPVGQVIAPGQTVTFTFSMEVTSAVGSQKIEFFMYQTSLNFSFGLYSKPVTIEKINEKAALVTFLFPESMIASQIYEGSITLSNTGNTIWSAPGDYQIQAGFNASPVMVTPLTGLCIRPGEMLTVSFPLTAAEVHNAGKYQLNVVFYHQQTAKKLYNGYFSWSIIPAQRTMLLSQTVLSYEQIASRCYEFTVEIQNNGNVPWTEHDRYEIMYRTEAGVVTSSSINGLLNEGSDVLPGQKKKLRLRFKLPANSSYLWYDQSRIACSKIHSSNLDSNDTAAIELLPDHVYEVLVKTSYKYQTSLQATMMRLSLDEQGGE